MRFKVCMKCKEYVPIHPENSISYNIVKRFEFLHYKHPLQTLNSNEVPKDFKLVILVEIGVGGFQ